MKTKYFFIAAIAATMLISCADDAFIAEAPPVNNVDEGMAPILFTSNQQAFTRADFEGKAAADLLGNQFVVTGFKGTSTATPGGTVFDNYLVTWAQNTANTTESNSSNWEYVGVTGSPIAHATAHGITSQTIKYWDYTQAQYDFFAWSTGSKEAIYSGTANDGQVLVSDMNATPAVSSDDPNTGLKNAYTFTGSADDLAQCYISDLVTVKKEGKETGDNYGVADYAYNNPVKLKFRQLGTKVRIALYETVPGYSVRNVQFYTGADTDDAQATNAYLFTTASNQIFTSGTYTVYFPTVDTPTDADNNQAHIKFSGSGAQSTTVNWGGMNYTGREQSEKTTGNVFVGRTSNTASFAGLVADNYYKVFLPNENGTNLNLRVNYTLESIDGSGEVINVKGATAQVPLIYNTWKPGFAYTYIFKISDKTNGHTGVYDPTKPDDTTVNSDPAGLYPITFDAIVVNAEDDAKQETITLVSTPSITTYQNGSNVVNANEYEVLTLPDPNPKKLDGNIYVTVNDGTTANTPDLANGDLQDLTGKIALYTIPEGTTEAVVIDALQYQDDDIAAGANITGRNKVSLTVATITPTNEVTYGADGNKIDLTDGDKKKAAKFAPTANTTYAFVYTKTAQSSTEEKYLPVDFADATVKTKYRNDFKAVTAAGDVQKNVVYLTKTGDVYTKKTVFLGQGAGNLYTSNGSIYSPATTDYAVSGTTYFYTLNGTDYTEAHNVDYASFSSVTLYVKNGSTYVAKSDSEPVDGTAYYYLDGGNYIYCVIMPEQTTTAWYTLDTTTYVVPTETTAVNGITYFDKYTKNNGVRYAKVIKVQ